jgi:hypothetical protein
VCEIGKKRKDPAGSVDTASMIKGGGYVGARIRQPSTAKVWSCRVKRVSKHLHATKHKHKNVVEEGYVWLLMRTTSLKIVLNFLFTVRSTWALAPRLPLKHADQLINLFIDFYIQSGVIRQTFPDRPEQPERHLLEEP